MTKRLVSPLGAADPRSVLSSAEHRARNSDMTGWYHEHGVDLMTPKDQPRMAVYAVEDGVIGAKDGNPRSAGHHKEFSHSDDPKVAGYKIYLFGSDGAETYMYQHLGEVVDGLKPGDKVVAGQLIGYTGAPASGGPHLHFAVKNGDTDDFVASVLHHGPDSQPPDELPSQPTHSDPSDGLQSLPPEDLQSFQPPGDAPEVLQFFPIDANMTPWDPSWTQQADFSDFAGGSTATDSALNVGIDTAMFTDAAFSSQDFSSLATHDVLPDLGLTTTEGLHDSVGNIEPGLVDAGFVHSPDSSADPSMSVPDMGVDHGASPPDTSAPPGFDN